jgi:transcription elongation factor Elf1
MTAEELRRRLDEAFSACPFCGSAKLRAKILDGERVVSFGVSCDTCGGAWVEFYRFIEATDFVPGTKLEPQTGEAGDGI